MASRIILITGANTGIGYEAIRALSNSNRSYAVFVGGRSMSKVNDAIASARKEFPSSKIELLPLQVDIESDASIHSAFDVVKSKFGKLDVLINNAGAQFENVGGLSEREIWNRTWDVNVSGTQVMTSTFVPLLLESSDPRLLFLASGLSSLQGASNTAIPFNRPPAKGWPKSGPSLPAYRSAKAGLNMLMHEWHRMLTEDGVKVWCLSPGFLATGLGGNPERSKNLGAGDPTTAGAFIRDVVEGGRDADVGRVIQKEAVQPW